jgi:hypothetical protein
LRHGGNGSAVTKGEQPKVRLGDNLENAGRLVLTVKQRRRIAIRTDKLAANYFACQTGSPSAVGCAFVSSRPGTTSVHAHALQQYRGGFSVHT